MSIWRTRRLYRVNLGGSWVDNRRYSVVRTHNHDSPLNGYGVLSVRFARRVS
jgi:hypothetical protein